MPTVIEPHFPRTILIGLGGAGTETIARVYRRLQQFATIHPAANLSRIALLGIDIEPLGKHTLEAGQVLVEHESFLHLGGFSPANFIDAHMDDRDLRSWWDTDLNRALERLVTFDAAKAIRLLGRLGLYAGREHVRRALHARMQLTSVAASNPDQQVTGAEEVPPQIYLISGTCGGTGSGMFLDVSLMAYAAGLSAFGCVPEVTAMLVMPDFYAAVEPMHRARHGRNARAFFRETEYVLAHPTDFARWCMEPSRYQPGGGLTMPTGWSPFRLAFLLDHHVSRGERLGSIGEFSDYVAWAVYARFIAAKWERSNDGWENSDLEISEDHGHQRIYATLGLRAAAYPQRLVMEYLTGFYERAHLDYALREPSSKKELEDRAKAEKDSLVAPLAAAERSMRELIAQTVASGHFSRTTANDDIPGQVRSLWQLAQQKTETACARVTEGMLHDMGDYARYVAARLDHAMDHATSGLVVTDRVLDTVAEQLRVQLLRYREEREKADKLAVTAQEAIAGSTSAGGALNVWPQSRHEWVDHGNRTAAQMQQYYHAKVSEAGYRALYDALRRVVGETAQETDNVLGVHDIRRNDLIAGLRQRQHSQGKQGVDDSHLAARGAEKLTVYYPPFARRADLEHDPRLKAILDEGQLADPATLAQNWSTLLESWRADPAARVHLRDVARPVDILDVLFARMRTQAEAQMAGMALPTVLEGIEGGGGAVQAVISDLAKRACLMVQEAPHSKAFDAERKTVLIADGTIAQHLDDDLLRTANLQTQVVRGHPEEIVALSIAHRLSLRNVRVHDEWDEAAEAADQSVGPYIHKGWNPYGPETTRPRPVDNDTLLSFVLARFIDWLFFAEDGGTLTPEQRQQAQRWFHTTRLLRATSPLHPGSWVQWQTADPDRGLPDTGYYAARCAIIEGAVAVQEHVYLAHAFNEALIALGRHMDVADAGLRVMQHLQSIMDAEAWFGHASAYVMHMERSIEKAKRDHRADTAEALGWLLEEFTEWANTLIDDVEHGVRPRIAGPEQDATPPL